MPFGLTNAPATFQRGLDMIFTKFKWKTCLVYLDDVIIFSRTPEEHIRHVDEVLACLSAAGVTLKISKCKFFTKTVEYRTYREAWDPGNRPGEHQIVARSEAPDYSD